MLKAYSREMNREVIIQLLKPCVFNQSNENLNKVIDNYLKDNHELYIFELEGTSVAVAGVKIESYQHTLKHIAVSPQYQRLGIGRKIINDLVESLKISRLIAETDEDAVDFYRTCGFNIQSLNVLNNEYTRYRCVLHLNPE